jgi:T5SS/PEP-CTERM-associated repeat protein
LTIQNGGVVSNANTQIACNSGSVGTLTVTGAGSQLDNAGAVYVGLGGQGALTVQDGGQVSDSSAFVGDVSGSAGDALVDDGTWTTSGLLGIGVGGTGVVTVEDGGDLSAGYIAVGGSGSLIIDPSTVDVSGGFTLDANGVLSLDIGGITPGLLSQLDISGFGLFDGTIDLDFIDGFAPTTGESFDLINALGADFSGATIQVEGLEPGFLYTDGFANGQFTLVAGNNGVSSSTPEPSSLWLVATALAALSLAWLGKSLKGRSGPVKWLV